LLPSGNSERPLAAVEEELRTLETLCGTLETALMRGDWAELNAAVADSRRVTHALQNALDDARGMGTPSFDQDVLRRIRYVFAIRQNQMARLQQFNEAIGERLSLLARWKSAMRSMSVARKSSSRLASLNQLS
jgi:hypothetical protein